MYSFYGGRPGAPFVITKAFETVNDMVEAFSEGANYTDVHYDEYVIINTVDKNDSTNGAIYRRGYNFTDEMGGAEYIGTIVGPAGPAPSFEMEEYNVVVNKTDSPHYTTGELTEVNQGLVSGEKNHSIKWASYTIKDENSTDSVAYIGFQIPYPYFKFNVQTISPYSSGPTASRNASSEPFKQVWDLGIPGAKKGNDISNLTVTQAGEDDGVEPYAGQNDDRQNKRSIITYRSHDYSQTPTIEKTNYLGDYNIIKDVQLADDGTLVFSFTHNDNKSLNNKIKWVKQVQLNNGSLTITYNDNTSQVFEKQFKSISSITSNNVGELIFNYNTNESDTITTAFPVIDDITLDDAGLLTFKIKQSSAASETKDIQMSQRLSWINGFKTYDNGEFRFTYNTDSEEETDSRPSAFVLKYITSLHLLNDGTITAIYNTKDQYGNPDQETITNNKIKWPIHFTLNNDGNLIARWNNNQDEVIGYKLRWIKDVAITSNNDILMKYSDSSGNVVYNGTSGWTNIGHIYSTEIQQLARRVESLVSDSSPVLVRDFSDMTDQNKIYLYLGQNGGVASFGKWYYYNLNTGEWTAGGFYGSGAGVLVNKTIHNLMEAINKFRQEYILEQEKSITKTNILNISDKSSSTPISSLKIDLPFQTQFYKDFNIYVGTENLIKYPYYNSTKEPYNNAGITYVSNPDGSITLNGTTGATGYSIFFLCRGLSLSPGTYYIAGCPFDGGPAASGSTSGPYRLRVVNHNNTNQIIASDTGKGASFTLTETTQIRYILHIGFGDGTTTKTINNLTIKPGLFKQMTTYSVPLAANNITNMQSGQITLLPDQNMYIDNYNDSQDEKLISTVTFADIYDGKNTIFTNTKRQEKIHILYTSIYEIKQNVETQKDLKVKKQLKNAAIASKLFTLVHIGDVHQDTVALDRILQNSLDIDKNNVIDDYICTGDMVNYKGEPIESWWPGSILTTIGNHDACAYNENNQTYTWSALSMQDKYDYYIKPFLEGGSAVLTTNKSYYYVDYSAKKIRLIVLDCTDPTFASTDSNQYQWLDNLLNTNYHILIATHAPYSAAVPVDCAFSKYGEASSPSTSTDCDIPQIVVSRINTLIRQNNINFIGYIASHTHQDGIWDCTGDGSQLIYTVTCACTSEPSRWDSSDQYRDETLDAYNIITIDTNKNLIKIVRCGGADIDCYLRKRESICINYKTKTIVSQNGITVNRVIS